MQNIKNNIVNAVLEFIKTHEFNIPINDILNQGVERIRICYKSDYFDEHSEYYNKGIGDVIVQFNSGYIIVIKETISSTWCFALLKSPNSVLEEVWHLSEAQQKKIPALQKALEDGFAFKNRYGNLNINFQEFSLFHTSWGEK